VESIIGDKMDFINQNKWLSILLDDNAQKSIKEKLAEKVDEIIADKAPGAIAAIVDRYRAEIMDARICDLYARFEDREEELIAWLTGLYTSILGDNLGRLLKAINIEKIVVDKINGLDPAELETVIFGVMKRELRAIVYLGALLGFLMGFINLLL
jgi:uncharacterized membrane protein YheB (UPF0754 family)